MTWLFCCQTTLFAQEDTLENQQVYAASEGNSLNRDFLIKLSKDNKYAREYYPLLRREIKIKAYNYVAYKKDETDVKIDCRFLCYSDSGIFIYKQKYIEYIPYRDIKFIQRDLSLKKYLRIAAITGGILSLFIIPSLRDFSEIIFLFSPPAVLTGYTLMFMGPITGISSLFKGYRFPINYSQSKVADFKNRVWENPNKWGLNTNILDYTLIDTPKILDQKTIAVQQLEIKNDSLNSPQNTVVEILPEVKQSKDLSTFKNPSGKMNPLWISANFVGNVVNEKKLLEKFKNIQGSNLTPEILQNLKSEELQFLAMTICNLNGFSFAQFPTLTASQIAYLRSTETYLSTEIKANTEIDLNNFNQTDSDNLSTIYSVLKEKLR